MRVLKRAVVIDVLLVALAALSAYALVGQIQARAVPKDLSITAAAKSGVTAQEQKAVPQRLQEQSAPNPLTEAGAISSTLALLPPGTNTTQTIVRHVNDSDFSTWLDMSPVGTGNYHVWVVGLTVTGISSATIAQIIGLNTSYDYPVAGIYAEWREDTRERVSLGGLFGNEIPLRSIARFSQIVNTVGGGQ